MPRRIIRGVCKSGVRDVGQIKSLAWILDRIKYCPLQPDVLDIDPLFWIAFSAVLDRVVEQLAKHRAHRISGFFGYVLVQMAEETLDRLNRGEVARHSYFDPISLVRDDFDRKP